MFRPFKEKIPPFERDSEIFVKEFITKDLTDRYH